MRSWLSMILLGLVAASLAGSERAQRHHRPARVKLEGVEAQAIDSLGSSTITPYQLPPPPEPEWQPTAHDPGELPRYRLAAPLPRSRGRSCPAALAHPEEQ